MRSTAILILLFISVLSVSAQTPERAAILQVTEPGVDVLRVNTVNRVPITLEAIVGMGDRIFVSETGRARLRFPGSETTVILLPGSEYRIDRFEGNAVVFTFSATVVQGNTEIVVQPELHPDAVYAVNMPGMTMRTRLSQFSLRVEDDGRSSLLVFGGISEASTSDADADTVPEGFGVRSAPGEPLSDVVRAVNFDQLNAAIDGCTLTVNTRDDVSLNLRAGPSRALPLVGYTSESAIETAFGINASGGWYRYPLPDGGYGWFLASDARVIGDCAGLRVFPDTWREN